MNGKKPDLAILIGRMRGGPMGKGMPPEEDESKEDLVLESAKELVRAVKDDDAESAAAALRAAFTAIESESDEGSSDTEE